MRHFTRGHPLRPAIFCPIVVKSNHVKTIVYSNKPTVLTSFRSETAIGCALHDFRDQKSAQA